MISTEQIKELRDRTGVSVMQCRKALEEAKGDFDKAIIILRKLSSSIAEKKSDRNLGAGTVAAYVHGTGSVGTMVELYCETDFVAKNPEFKQLAYDIAMQIAATSPEFLKRENIAADAMQKIKEVFESEVKDKPKAAQAKILEGKIDAYFKDRVLLEQPFVKNPELTINNLIQTTIQKFGERIEVGKFVRFSVSK